MFPKIDAKRFNIHDDQKMVLDFLLQEKCCWFRERRSTGRGRIIRIVTLPRIDDIEMSLSKFERFLSGYHQLNKTRLLDQYDEYLHLTAFCAQ